ncbi:MAG: hypothetical protein LBE11_03995 [Prevotellaceae bacterium]|jgi:hypothetical protein|nr:hypothetical protein [Prevotellaceae bacterium]
MLRNRYFPLLLLLFTLVSCDRAAENPNKVFWGETEYYSNFLFKKYEPVIMKQTLELEFNKYAQKGVSGDIELEAVKKDKNGKFVRTSDIIIYKNGEQCADNILKIKPAESSIELGIEFSPNAKEGNHTLYLRVKNSGGLDRIDDVNLSQSDNMILVHEWVIKKDDILNPLAKILLWILIVAVILILVWRIFIRHNVFEPFKARTLFIFYPESPMQKLKIKGCLKVICSSKKQSQSVISRFFKGEIIFVKNEFWERDIEIVPRDKKSVRVRPSQGFTVMPSNTVTAGKEAEITYMNKITKLQIN